MLKRKSGQQPQSPPAPELKRARPASRPSHVAVRTILSLSDDALRLVFDNLSSERGTVSGHCVPGKDPALSLAYTCRRLSHFYRHTYAVTLDLTGRHNLTSLKLIHALERLPNVTGIVFNYCRWCEEKGSMTETFFGGARGDLFFRNRAASIKRLSLDFVSLSEENLCKIVATFSNLEHISLIDSHGASDKVVQVILDTLSGTLRTLRLGRFVRLGCSMTDASGERLNGLQNLKELHLGSCKGLTDASFATIGTLTELENLVINDTQITDSSACKILPRLTKLKALNMNNCSRVTGAILPLLPRSLVRLFVCQSGALADNVLPSAFESLPHLSVFHGSNCLAVTNLSFLSPVAAQLTEVYMPRSRLSDEGAAQVVSQMRKVDRLNLSSCKIGDETARAISTLKKVNRLDLNSTEITNIGMQAFATGAIRSSLTHLGLFYCSGISNDDGDIDALRAALASVEVLKVC